MTAEERLAVKLEKLGLQLPAPAVPKGVYRPLVRSGNLIFTAGHLPIDAAGKLFTGRLGENLDVEAGYKAAQLAGLCILATLRHELGSIDRVLQVVKVLGIVNCTESFQQQPAVINGCSELFAEVFEQSAGIAARSAIGSNSLPLGAAVEIEAIFEV